jgi:hypothetical protein
MIICYEQMHVSLPRPSLTVNDIRLLPMSTLTASVMSDLELLEEPERSSATGSVWAKQHWAKPESRKCCQSQLQLLESLSSYRNLYFPVYHCL